MTIVLHFMIVASTFLASPNLIETTALGPTYDHWPRYATFRHSKGIVQLQYLSL